ncbi:MAG: hypothetical protein HN453_00495 [Gammaproteobacteria bacterium]|nr:hypothetical protein [Gammaproteobacteria bacterium]
MNIFISKVVNQKIKQFSKRLVGVESLFRIAVNRTVQRAELRWLLRQATGVMCGFLSRI